MNLRILSIASVLTIALSMPALAEAESKLIQTTTPVAKPKKVKQDADGDGRISLQEHLDWQKQYFQGVDANNDGFLTKEERSAYAASKKAAATAASAKEEKKEGFFKRFMGSN